MRSPLLALLTLLLLLPAAPALADEPPAPWWQDDPAVVDDEQDTDGPGLPSADGGGSWFDDVQDTGDGTSPPSGSPALPGPLAPVPPVPAQALGRLSTVPYRSLIVKYARTRGLEAAFVAAIAHAESAFNPRARSRVGARGLMQLMPATARGLGLRSAARLYDPETNIAYGTLYLARVRSIVGSSPRLMAAAYNAGPGAVKKYRGVPPYAETRGYVARVTALRAQYRRG